MADEQLFKQKLEMSIDEQDEVTEEKSDDLSAFERVIELEHIVTGLQ